MLCREQLENWDTEDRKKITMQIDCGRSSIIYGEADTGAVLIKSIDWVVGEETNRITLTKKQAIEMCKNLLENLDTEGKKNNCLSIETKDVSVFYGTPSYDRNTVVIVLIRWEKGAETDRITITKEQAIELCKNLLNQLEK